MDEPVKASLQRFGLTSITANMGAAFQWDADKKTATLQDAVFSVEELGSLQLNADLVNIGPASPAGSNQPGFSKATLHYRDASLINRLLSAGGQRSQAQLAQMRQMFAANLLHGLGPVASDPKLASSVKAISDFAQTPQSLTITLVPPAPVPLATMKDVAAQGPQALFVTLGLSIAANQ